jgi:hypothetical protein
MDTRSEILFEMIGAWVLLIRDDYTGNAFMSGLRHAIGPSLFPFVL